jgi:hypothetical protein
MYRTTVLRSGAVRRFSSSLSPASRWPGAPRSARAAGQRFPVAGVRVGARTGWLRIPGPTFGMVVVFHGFCGRIPPAYSRALLVFRGWCPGLVPEFVLGRVFDAGSRFPVPGIVATYGIRPHSVTVRQFGPVATLAHAPRNASGQRLCRSSPVALRPSAGRASPGVVARGPRRYTDPKSDAGGAQDPPTLHAASPTVPNSRAMVRGWALATGQRWPALNHPRPPPPLAASLAPVAQRRGCA